MRTISQKCTEEERHLLLQNDASDALFGDDEYLVPISISKDSLINELKTAVNTYGDVKEAGATYMVESEKKFAELLDHDNSVNGKTILSREHILRTCKSEVKIAMLPIVIVMMSICVLSTIFIEPKSGIIEKYAILVLWIIGIITVVIQFFIMLKTQQTIKEALPSGNFRIYLARSQRRRRYSCYFEIDGKDRKVPSGALGQVRLLGEEDVYILMINDKITALYPITKFALDADLSGKMYTAHQFIDMELQE